ncbi:MAG: hypothetical protein CR997_08975 [Acidobacteria bacterium]|nr:MAG: hypothetical protein CR997_08975 [Acidobacteriota bacterium]
MISSGILILFLAVGQSPQAKTESKASHLATKIARSKINGPVLNDSNYQPHKSGHALLKECLEAVKKRWLPMEYQKSRAVELNMDMNLNVRPPRETGLTERMELDISVEGVAMPNEQYKLKVNGKIGEIDLIKSRTRRMTVYHTGNSFSDQPLPRNDNANINNYRSYALRHLGQMSDVLLNKGGYRIKYLGSGNYQGQLIDRIGLSKASSRKGKRKTQKAPVPMNRIWTFWQTGQYEVWIYQGSKLPAAVFYANPDDHIYANFTIDYNQSFLPDLFVLQNNSTGFEGRTEIRLHYTRKGLLELVSFEFHTSDGHQMHFNARLRFLQEAEDGLISGIPPFGYQKINQDHLKLLLMTQTAGNLLNLKQHGLKLKNFKF